jgi:hypothetical protein
MMCPRLVLRCALLGLASVACGLSSHEPEPAPDGHGTVGPEHLAITVSGHAELFPEAAHLLESQGLPLPRLEGLTLTIEEPLRVVVGHPGATLGQAPISSGGAFSVSGVRVRDIHQSLAAGLHHEGLVRSSTLVFDTVFTGAPPRTDILGARAWALPSSFHEALTGSVGEPTLLALTEGRARTLLEAGFILGRVVDGAGQPVAGARVAPDHQALAERVLYPAPDRQGATRDATSASGLFLYVHSGRDAESLQLSLPDTPDAPPRHASIAPGLGLVLTLYPGTLAPYPPRAREGHRITQPRHTSGSIATAAPPTARAQSSHPSGLTPSRAAAPGTCTSSADTPSVNPTTHRDTLVLNRLSHPAKKALATTSDTSATALACATSPPAPRLRSYPHTTSPVINPPAATISPQSPGVKKRACLNLGCRSSLSERALAWNTSSAVGWRMSSSQTMWMGRYSSG